MDFLELENFAKFKGFIRRRGFIENQTIEHVEFENFNFANVRRLENVTFRKCKLKQNDLHFFLGCKIRDTTFENLKCSHMRICWGDVDIQNLRLIGKGVKFLEARSSCMGRSEKMTLEKPGLFLDISQAQISCITLIGMSCNSVKINPELHYCLDFSNLSNEDGLYSGHPLKAHCFRDALWRLEAARTKVGIFEKPFPGDKDNEGYDDDVEYLSNHGCLKKNVF